MGLHWVVIHAPPSHAHPSPWALATTDLLSALLRSTLLVSHVRTWGFIFLCPAHHSWCNTLPFCSHSHQLHDYIHSIILCIPSCSFYVRYKRASSLGDRVGSWLQRSPFSSFCELTLPHLLPFPSCCIPQNLPALLLAEALYLGLSPPGWGLILSVLAWCSDQGKPLLK